MDPTHLFELIIAMFLAIIALYYLRSRFLAPALAARIAVAQGNLLSRTIATDCRGDAHSGRSRSHVTNNTPT
jgi:hypothetical protein